MAKKIGNKEKLTEKETKSKEIAGNQAKTESRPAQKTAAGEDAGKEKNTARKKGCKMLVAGAALLIIGIIAALFTYHASSPVPDKEPKELLPYSCSLMVVFFAVLLTVKGICNALVGVRTDTHFDVKRLAQAGLLTALCYIGFAFFKIDIPAGTEKAAFHFGNVFCVLAALLLGGYWGGLAGAVGMTIGDLTTAYVTSAPKTFLLKLCIGLIVGLVAHKIFKLSRNHSARYVTGVTIAASACGMAFNVVADPLAGYFYKTYLFGVPQDVTSILVKISALTTGVNAVVAVVAASILYLALRPALQKARLFAEL